LIFIKKKDDGNENQKPWIKDQRVRIHMYELSINQNDTEINDLRQSSSEEHQPRMPSKT
jgi:hypothetical protein